MSTPTESPASDAARTPDVPVTPPDVSADDELSADERALLVENLRYTLDGRWRAVRDTVREQSNRSELLPDPSRTLY